MAFTTSSSPPLTPAFVPQTRDVLLILSYSDKLGRLAPIMEDRWREFELAVSGAQDTIRLGWGGWWSRPQNTTCPTDLFYDLGPAESIEQLETMQLTGHTVSARYRQPADVTWLREDAISYDEDLKVMERVPAAFVKVCFTHLFVLSNLPCRILQVETIVDELMQELLPWNYSQEDPPISDNVRPMLSTLRKMSTIGRRRG
ncbi:hypothetical protein C8J57DRAFT_1345149 [Mycena rebaudengoi]|nr:hypothetical protein C8J57DRAFT_1345149 [Mycena rebaudengoi]